MNNPIRRALEITGLTQEELAKRLGISRQTLINYENNPDTIPAGTFLDLSEITGVPVNELMNYKEKKIPSPKLVPFYEEEALEAQNLIDRLDAALTDSCLDSEDDKHYRDEIKSILQDIRDNAKFRQKKPVIASFGIPNSGKSTLFNYIIGEEIAPTDYQPSTTTLTYFRHISEKPYNMDELYNARIEYKVHGEEKLGDGTHEWVLKECGSRGGSFYEKPGVEVTEINVYLDKDILKEFTYLDVPGFGSERQEEDSGLALKMRDIDYIFFLSSANVFLCLGIETTALNDFISKRGGIDTISVLATHSDIIGDPAKLSEMLDKACARLVDAMADEKAAKYKDPQNYAKLRSHFKLFDCNNSKYCKEFNDDFSQSIRRVTRLKFITLYNELRVQCQRLKEVCSEKSSNFKGAASSAVTSEDDEQKKFGNGLSGKLEEFSGHMDEVIEICRKNSNENWAHAYFGIINENFILSKIEQKDIKNNKKDKELLASYLSDELNNSLNNIIKKESEYFSNELNSQIKKMEEWSKQYSFGSNIEINFNGFDFQRAFAAGLTGAGVFGALAAWAAVVAGGSNLGAYILCAKVVSVLSGLGISLGGTAAVNAAVAAIGGPATIGIALAVLAAGAVFGIFSGTWKKRFAKALIDQYGKQSNDYYKYIDRYWDETKDALKNCLNSLETQTAEHHKNLLHTLSLTDMELEKSKDRMLRVYAQIIKYIDEILNMLDKREKSDDIS